MSTKLSSKITRAQMRDALLRSGYLLESRVESALRKSWGYVEANPTYPDPDTGVSREYDVRALKAYPLSNFGAQPSKRDIIFTAIAVECINNPQPLVVLTKNPLTDYLLHDHIKAAGIPAQVAPDKKSGPWRGLSVALKMNEYHHYWGARIGSQFCSFQRKKVSGAAGEPSKQEWMALHDGSHFDAFKKLCHVTDHLAAEQSRKKVKPKGPRLRGRPVNLELYYPLVVVQGDLVEAQETKTSVTLRKAEHLQLRQSISRPDGAADYHIDIIRERHLPRYLELLDKEGTETAQRLANNYEMVNETRQKLEQRILSGEVEAKWTALMRHSSRTL